MARALALLIAAAAGAVALIPAIQAWRPHVGWAWAALDLLLACRLLAPPTGRRLIHAVGIPMILLTAAFAAGPLGPGLGLAAAFLAVAGIVPGRSQNGPGAGL